MTRAKPRLGLIGFSADEVKLLTDAFPTVWSGTQYGDLVNKVDPAELDLLASKNEWPSLAFGVTRVACFGVPNSAIIEHLGTGSKGIQVIFDFATKVSGEGFFLPPVAEHWKPLQSFVEKYFRRQERGARDAVPAQVSVFNGPPDAAKFVNDELLKGALVGAESPRRALATITEHRGRFRALFPFAGREEFDRVLAIHLIAEGLAHIAATDFPPLPSWEAATRWKTSEELALHRKLEAVRERRDTMLRQFALEEDSVEAEIAQAHDVASRGQRRLLTEQGEPLVEAVEEALRAFGFTVRNGDADAAAAGAAKREDLVVELSDGEVALAEVKGERNRTARVKHFYQLFKHSGNYARTTGRTPKKLIVIHNGQFALPPERRPRPFAGATEELADIVEDGHLVISTTDLFEMRRDLGSALAAEDARKLIESSAGVLSYKAPSTNANAAINPKPSDAKDES